MRIFHMAYGGASIGKYSTCISKDEYKELMIYARERSVKLEGFKKFSGDILIIKELIDDIVLIANDFSLLLNARRSVVVRLDEHLSSEDFATTDRHLISINAQIFNNRDYLEHEYKMLSESRKYVEGTTYRSIICHEIGHVVANIYHLDVFKIAREIFPNKSKFEILEYINNNISKYASDYPDGREFISECFSAYYGGVDNWFAKEYVKKCKDLVREVNHNDKK